MTMLPGPGRRDCPRLALLTLMLLSAACESPTRERAQEVVRRDPPMAAVRADNVHPWVGLTISIFNQRPDGVLLCWDVMNAHAAPHEFVQQFPCHFGINQRFRVAAMPTSPTRTDKSFVMLQSAQNPSLCVDIPNGTANGGEVLQLFPCHNGPAQSFFLPFPGPICCVPPGFIQTEVSHLQMVIEMMRPLSLRVLQQNPALNNTVQKWQFRNAATGMGL